MYGTTRKITKEIEKVPYNERPNKVCRFLKTLKPHDQTAYFFYRKHRKTDHYIGEDRTKFANSVKSIYQAIAELMLEKEGGVFLEEYGYFTSMIVKYKKSKLAEKYRPPFHTDGEYYALQLFSNFPKSCIKRMSMDATFEQPFKSKFSKAIYAMFRPKLYYTTIQSLYGFKNKKLY